jgi:hypothetical protein
MVCFPCRRGVDFVFDIRSVYVACADPSAEGDDFLNATWRVRCVDIAYDLTLDLTCFEPSDTLEQIDVARLLIEKYPDVCFSPHHSCLLHPL